VDAAQSCRFWARREPIKMVSEKEIISATKALRRALKRRGYHGAVASGSSDDFLFDGQINLKTLARLALEAAERERVALGQEVTK
jgi:hypothetical protein